MLIVLDIALEKLVLLDLPHAIHNEIHLGNTPLPHVLVVLADTFEYVPLNELDAKWVEAFTRHARVFAPRAPVAAHVAVARELLSAKVLAEQFPCEHRC